MDGLSYTKTLSNGVGIPIVGYGSWKTPAGQVCVGGVKCAIESGYRHIDTASVYLNEESVGQGIRESGVSREDIFLTTKLWNTDQGYDSTIKAFYASLQRLKTEYVDLYLIHWPIARDFKDIWQDKIVETWAAFENLYMEGRIRAIGVSNFLPRHLSHLLDNCQIKPMVNQLELHIGYHQPETVQFCRQNDIVLEAWSPLCKGKAFDIPVVKAVSIIYNRTPAQILLRWCLQKGFIPLPKSVTPSRIIENAQLFDFQISASDMALLDKIDTVGRLGSYPDDPQF